jgi:hypothetical protein
VHTHACTNTHTRRSRAWGAAARAHMQVDSGSHSLCVRLGLSGAVAYPSQCGKYGMQRNAQQADRQTDRQTGRRALLFVRSRSHTTTTSPSSVRLAGAEGAFRQTDTAQSTGWRVAVAVATESEPLGPPPHLWVGPDKEGIRVRRREQPPPNGNLRQLERPVSAPVSRVDRLSKVRWPVARLFFRLDRFRLDQFPLGPFLLRPVPA